eukprot:scpid61811/ scgid15392/ 
MYNQMLFTTSPWFQDRRINHHMNGAKRMIYFPLPVFCQCPTNCLQFDDNRCIIIFKFPFKLLTQILLERCRTGHKRLVKNTAILLNGSKEALQRDRKEVVLH